MIRCIGVFAIVLSAVAAAHTSLLAQTIAPPQDTMTAIKRAKEIAQHEPTSGYFFGSFLATPATVLSVGYVLAREPLHPGNAFGPAGMILLGAHASKRVSMSGEAEMELLGADSAYAAAFRRHFESAVKHRRANAIVFGGIAGTASAAFLLSFLFEGAID